MRVFTVFWLSLSIIGQDFLRDNLPLINKDANKTFEQGNYEEALKQYLDLYGQDTTNGALAYNIANTYLAMGDGEKAKQFYERALKSEHPEAKRRSQFNMGYLNLQGQQPAEAIKQYVDYLRESPHDLDAKRNLELALRQLQQQEQEQQQQQQEQQQQDNQDQQQDDPQNQEQSQQGDNQQDDQSDQGQDDSQQEQSQDQPNDPSDEPQDQQDQSSDQQPQDNQQGDSSQQQEQQDTYNDEMKEQILQALQDQESQQQKEFQKRKMGSVKRRAKDW
ncbi:MAG: tetratricopeptide repeat protein [Acidobacteria bacterium]|nr:tetratricopeptide repeat protein [Acidobacteriota bacterium]